ncbi:aspartate/glutamate racemase family protein [Parasphingorhabdus sp. DH2-15]|uniref:aspartate/glutamate racemase family protein n=1 Tax=Parasphingorhabdus sp. DH2-15 TaxID=3444112 RepID=UPI003F687F22
MRKVGLLGGMSWASTITYYRHINRDVQRRAGGMCSAPLIIESFNFCDLSRLEKPEQWEMAADKLGNAAQRLEKAGATALLICANSMHRVADDIASQISIPLIHIADCVGQKMQEDNIRKAAIIGTRNVMTESFYRRRLVSHGVNLMTPNMVRVTEIDRIIYDELMQGNVNRDSQRTMKTFLTDIAKEDIEAIVLGSTELEMLVNTQANVLPIYDSTKIHADAAVDWILTAD